MKLSVCIVFSLLWTPTFSQCYTSFIGKQPQRDSDWFNYGHHSILRDPIIVTQSFIKHYSGEYVILVNVPMFVSLRSEWLGMLENDCSNLCNLLKSGTCVVNSVEIPTFTVRLDQIQFDAGNAIEKFFGCDTLLCHVRYAN